MTPTQQRCAELVRAAAVTLNNAANNAADEGLFVMLAVSEKGGKTQTVHPVICAQEPDE